MKCDRCNKEPKGLQIELFGKKICRDCYLSWTGLRDSQLAVMFEKFMDEQKHKHVSES